MASRDLADLHPEMKSRAIAFLNSCKRMGVELLITCTYRSHDEQNRLYAIGRTIPGKKVTNAMGGQSKHNHIEYGSPASLAMDVVPIIDGKLCWDEKHPVWQVIGREGEKAGLTWAGRWKRFKEYPHFEYNNG